MVGMNNHDVFSRNDVAEIFTNRFIVVIGDSNQRAFYKDLVLLLQTDRLLSQGELRAKGEYSFLGDDLIEGGRKGEMTNGIAYREVRQYHTDTHLVRFYFTTRCFNSYVESILRDLKSGPSPDLVVMNSCLWDITRYGKASIVDYKDNLQTLFSRFQQSLPADCLVVWTTTLPISSSARGGFLVPEIEFMSTTLRLDILEANFYAKKVAADHGYDVLDLHFYLRHYLHCRVKDGVHWDFMAHRYITNLMLSHVCDAWGICSPAKRPATFASYGSVAGMQRRHQARQSQYSHDYNDYSYQAQDSHQRHDGYGYRNQHQTRGGGGSGQPFHNLMESMQMSTALTNFQLQDAFRSFQKVWNGPVNAGGYQWESYQDNRYRATAPSRRQERMYNNPYHRNRRGY